MGELSVTQLLCYWPEIKKHPDAYTNGIRGTRSYVIVPHGIAHYSIKSALQWIGCGSIKTEYGPDNDVDVCVLKKRIPHHLKLGIARIIRDLHVKNGLKLDNDIAYENKTSFSEIDINNLTKLPPFINDGDIIKFTPIEFSREFLDSYLMRLRLLLNILTTNAILIYGNVYWYEKIVCRGYNILLSYILKTTRKSMTLKQMINQLYFCDKSTYKNYLGYNIEDKEQKNFIINHLRSSIMLGLKSGDLIKTNNRIKRCF